MLNGDSSQASETTPVEVTKKSIRSQIWQHLQKNRLSVRPLYSTIPSFLGAEEAAAELRALPAFQDAKHILVNPDRAQITVRMACLQAQKTLYVQPPRLRNYIMTCLQLTEELSEAEYQEALTVKGLEKFGKTIGLDDELSLDMIVVGSVAVSKDGYRVGRGNGYVDLYFGLLMQMKAIRPETVVVTTVHDEQVLDSMPLDIFGPHDFPVDIIVTPTQVIHTQRTCPRPSGVLWELLSERRCKYLGPVLELREKEIQAGNPCTLKEVESDMDSDRENGRPRNYFKGRRFPRNKRRPTHTNGTHSESEQQDGAEGENGNGRKGPRTFYKRYYRFRRNTDTTSDGVTKKSYRNKAWQLLQKNRVAVTPRSPFNRIPGYKGAEQAAQLLRGLDCYKAANSIIVNIDKSHEPLRLACLEDEKQLYVLLPRLQKEFVMKVEVPEGEKQPELKDVISRQGMEEYGRNLDLSEEFKADLIVVGSLAVSKEGYRIGKGNGYMDLCYALLLHLKTISPETLIVTTVHDYQVFETLPIDLFGEQDIPVDIIVTPTQVIETHTVHKKPTAIMWNLLTERRVKVMQVISDVREKEILAGNPCVLKEEDPNEVVARGKRRDKYRRSNNYSESEQNDVSLAEGESGDHNRKPRSGHTPRRYGRQRRNTNEKGEHEGGAESGGNVSPDTTTVRKRRQQMRRNKPQIDFTIKLTNIERSVRIRDLRSALQERSVKPNIITWVGYKGYCYLHFAKPAPPVTPESEASTPVTSDSIIDMLANLTLYPSEPGQDTTTVPLPNKLVVQLAKPQTRIETADETAV